MTILYDNAAGDNAAGKSRVDSINSIGGAFTIVVSVLLVFVGVSLANWARGCMEAEDLNRRLAQLQKGM